MLKYPIALFLILGIFGTIYYYAYGIPFNSDSPITPPISPMTNEVPYVVEEVARNLEVPWSIVFTANDRMLVAERPGRIRVLENGSAGWRLREELLHTFREVSSGGEEGLMGLAVHPVYEQNAFVYAVYAYEAEGAMYDRVVRFKDEGSRISGLTTILDSLPAARYHAGSRLAFGPDGKLYITTGDATDREIAQNLQSLGGKILRVNDDGSIPGDNPFPQSPIWSFGHRNSQGISWDSQGNLYSTEHGPSGFDGPGGGDEVNRIIRGGNYGWPLVSHEKKREGTIAPLTLYTPAEAPASALMYRGENFPQFKNNLFFGGLRGEGLWRLQFDENDPDKIIGQDKLFDGEYGRIREVTEGPDGAIYFSTSNRDGRGDPIVSDDRILRIVPEGR